MRACAWLRAALAGALIAVPGAATAQETEADTLAPATPADTLAPSTTPRDTLVPAAPADALPSREATGRRERPTSEVLLSPEILVEISRLGIGGIPLGRVPYETQVLPGEEIREEASLTIADALVRLPGVTAADQFGVPYQPDIRLRGFAVSPVVGLPQSLSVFVDGVRVNEPDASQVQFDLIPLDDIDRLEVVRGPGGPFGRNTLGGAVNVRTMRGSGPPSGRLEAGGGSFGRLEGRGTFQGSVGTAEKGAFDWYLSGRYHDADGWRQATDARLEQGFAKVGWRQGATDAWLSYTFANNDIMQPGSLPTSWLEGGPLPERFQDVDDRREINYTGGDFYRPELHFLVGTLSRELSSALSLTVNGYGRFLDVDQFNANISEPDFVGVTDIRSGGATAQATLRPSADGAILSAEVEYVRHDVDIEIFEAPNEFFPDVERRLTEHVGTEEENAGLFAQVWAPLSDRLSGTASLRFDHVRVPFQDFLNPEDSGTNDFNELSGVLGFDVEVTPRTFAFASYGRGFRAPVILEITCSDPEDPCPLPFELGADPPIDPVRADSWQGGVRYLTEALSLEGLAYWTEVYDDIFNVIVPPSTRGFFKNVEQTRRQGVELTLSAAPRENLTLNASFALTRATFRTSELLASALLDDDESGGESQEALRRPSPAGPAESGEGDDEGGDGEGGPTEVEPGDEFSMVPNVTFNLGGDLELGAWSFSLDGIFVGSQWLVGDESNTRPEDKLDPYFVLDAYLARELGPVTAFALVENVLDLEYETFGIVATNVLGPGDPEAIDPFLTPGMPRRVYAGLRFAW